MLQRAKELHQHTQTLLETIRVKDDDGSHHLLVEEALQTLRMTCQQLETTQPRAPPHGDALRTQLRVDLHQVEHTRPRVELTQQDARLLKHRLKQQIQEKKRVLQQLQLDVNKVQRDIQGEQAVLQHYLQLKDRPPLNDTVSKTDLMERTRHVQRELARFLDEHYPVMYLDAQGQGSMDYSPDKTRCSLRDLVEKLMNHAASGNYSAIPTDPTKHWTPYIHVLLAAGIVQVEVNGFRPVPLA